MNIPLLKALSEAPDISPRERVREILKKEMKPLFDELKTDAAGNLIATKRAKGKNGSNGAKRVLIACHIDRDWFLRPPYRRQGISGGFKRRRVRHAPIYCRRVRVQCERRRRSLSG